MSVFATAALSSLLLPPLVFVLAALAGLLLARRRRRLGIALVLVALGSLTAASTPYVGERLLRSLESPALAMPAPAPAGAYAGPRAIVVLGGGLSREAPEYGSDSVNPSTLLRLRYGAWLHRQTGLPLLVTGGRPLATRLSEAETMAQSLSADFRAAPRWVEAGSLNTRENAERSRALLASDSIRHVYLVTHAWHMARARRAFERAGLTVTEAPTGFTSLTPIPLAFVPGARALEDTRTALREWLGEAWYRLHSGFANRAAEAGARTQRAAGYGP